MHVHAIPPCHTWSCDRPLATELGEDWPAWPPAASNAIPRDNLPSKGAEQRWRTLHAQQVAEAKAATAQTRVAFLGDSITEGWIRTGFSGRKPSMAQPQNEKLWRENFGSWAPLNLGIGGDRVQDLGWRLQHGLLPHALQPSVFVVLIGTNDLGSGEQWEVVASELSLVLRQLHAARPSALVLAHAILPRGNDEFGGADSSTRATHRHRSPWWSESTNDYHGKIRRLNAEVARLASRNGDWLRYVDCSHEFIERTVDPADQYEPRPPLPAPSTGDDNPFEQHIPLSLMYDLLHLTPEGYRRWAGCLRPRLTAALAEFDRKSTAKAHEGADGGSSVGVSSTRTGARGTATGARTRPSRRQATADDAPVPCIGRSCRGGDDPGGLDLA